MKDEIADKKKCAIQDFEKLINDGEIGFYNSCELTIIFLIENETSKIFNYYTLFNFEEKSYYKRDDFLTKPPLSVNDKYKFGVRQLNIKIEDAINYFHSITSGNFSINTAIVELSKKSVLLPKQLVSSFWDYDVIPPLGKILKPNNWGDSYIIEYFSEGKKLLKSLSNNDVDKINNFITEIESVKIDFTRIYDHIESIIFQFPINIINCTHSLNNTDKLDVTVYTHPNIDEPMDIVITAKTSLDNVTTGYSNLICKTSETPVTLSLGDSNKLELYISKINSDILLHQSLSNYIRSFGGLLLSNMLNSEPRTIITRKGIDLSVSISNPMPMSVGERKDDYFTQIRKRITENELLKNSGDCRVFDVGMQEEAFEFIRGLILKNNKGVKEICLWDPYLKSPDIIETLYFQNTGIPFKCITSLKKAREIKNNGKLRDKADKTLGFNDFKMNELEYFEKNSNNLRVQLEFRCQHDKYGTPFHDRFLIFSLEDSNELPIVYSLGTSVNSIGTSHHIIQKVTDSRLILKNFYNMWDYLDNEECLIAKFPKGKL